MWRNLGGNEWRLSGWLPYSHRFNAESGINFQVAPLIAEIPARVPGSVQADLLRAGLLRNPFLDDGSLLREWVENKGWLYSRTFVLTAEDLSKNLSLYCGGIVYEARFYLNGKRLGIHKNMFIPAEFSLNGFAVEGINRLEIHCEPIPEGISQMGNTSDCKELLARYFYSWDFSPRMTGVGIWREIGLKLYEKADISNVNLRTDYRDEIGTVEFSARLTGATEKAVLKLELRFEDRVIETREIRPNGNLAETSFAVERPALWWPNGAGAQPLYELRVTLWSGLTLEYEKNFFCGIRRIEYLPNEGAPEDALPYTIAINGKKIWLKGTNFLPVSHMPGSVTPQDYAYYLNLMVRENVNLVRIWGGGYPEQSCFYDLCDRFGLLVWQEMPQSNSGIDGVPSTRSEFIGPFLDACRHTVLRLRRHTCIAIWDGGNELKKTDGSPADLSNENLARTAALISQLDGRIFHPSCPSGPNFNHQADPDSLRLKRNHNVHGQWAYLGKETHYDYYNAFENLYHGEFGAGGCADVFSLGEILSPEHIERFAQDDPMWLMRGNGWWDSVEREQGLFGLKVLEHIENFAAASQLVQAEGVRYIVEFNRRRAFANSGCNIWQLNEPFPNANCSSLICYHGRAKMAYYTVRDSYAPVQASLKYTRLYYRPGEKFASEVYLHCSCRVEHAEVCAELFNAWGQVLARQWEKLQGTLESRRLFAFEPETPAGEALLFVRLTVSDGERLLAKNLYCFGVSEEKPLAPLFETGDGRLFCRVQGEGKSRGLFLRNDGEQVIPYLALQSPDDPRMLFNSNFITLFPGEHILVNLEGKPDASVRLRDFSGRIDKTVRV